MLEDSQLITRETDPFRKGRSLYRITEPLIIFYEAIMRREWTRLERGDTAGAWHNSQATFLSQVVGPHFEAVCRDWARWPIRSGAARSRLTWLSSRPTRRGARVGCYLSVKPSGTRS